MRSFHSGGNWSRGFLWLPVIVCAVAVAGATTFYLQGFQFKVPVAAANWLPQWRTPSEEPVISSRPPVQVKVAQVRNEDVPIVLDSIGTVHAYNTVSVQSRVDGEITQILFQEGQNVQQGDALAIIDPRPLQAQLDQQLAILQKDEALLAGAILDLERYETLTKTAAASRQQFDQQRALVDQYRAQIKNDQAQVDYARTQLGFTTIRASLSGRIGIRKVDQGNFVRAITPSVIAVITQMRPISVILTVSAAALTQTQFVPGQTMAHVTALDQDNVTELDQGTIDLVDNQVDQTTGTIKLKASFPNAAQKLWPGNFVNGRITLEVRHNGLTVPAVAVRHGPLGDFVWVARPDHTAAYRVVSVGQIKNGRALIDRGLDKGEQVVVEGYFRLDGGATIEIVPDDAPSTRRKRTSSAAERG